MIILAECPSIDESGEQVLFGGEHYGLCALKF